MSLTLLPFSRLPGEVLMDSRLKPQHIRVLIALYMHANKRSEVVWPKRKTLARLTGIREATISSLTSELEAFGWVTKANNSGGCNRPASYRMHVPDGLDSGLDVRLTDDGDLACPTPETALDLSTVPESGTVPKSSTPTLPKSGTRTLPKSGTGKEQPIEQPIEQPTLLSPDESDDQKAAAKSPKAEKLPACPHLEILAEFAEILPELPQPKPELWDGARAKALSARWKWCLSATNSSTGKRYAETKDEALAWFARFFRYVGSCPHLMGRFTRL